MTLASLARPRALSSGLAVLLGAVSLPLAACGGRAHTDAGQQTADAPVPVDVARAIERPISRVLRVTGSLTAQDLAEVAAETQGRVVSTPIERGSRVAAGDVLVRVSADETDAQALEAEANVAQLEAKLGLAPGDRFDPLRVPEVLSARAQLDWAESEYARITSLRDDQLVSQADYDQRRSQRDAAAQQYQVAQNGAAQSYRALEAARARLTLARKALADTVVRAPFDGLVGERLVSVGDYVTRGTRVATVVRVDPVRAELTIPEQSVSAVAEGQPVTITVDAFADRAFTGHVRHVSPALRSTQRALIVEALVPNPHGLLKPGMFVVADIEQPQQVTVLLIPEAAVQRAAGTARVFVIRDGVADERIVSVGQAVGDLVEVTEGVAVGETVATSNLNRLADGLPVSAAPLRASTRPGHDTTRP